MGRNAFGTEKDALTTGEVARICNVAARTVSNWIDAGRLQGYRIPGSRDRRVHVSALEAFIAANGIPVTANALSGTAALRVLVVDADRSASETLREVLSGLGEFTVETASEPLAAAIACGASAPDAVVFDLSAGDPGQFVTALRARGMARTRFVASGTDLPEGGRSFLRAGFDAALAKPYSVRQLLDALAPVRRARTRRAV